jgi:histone deacetylase 1/2
MWLFRALRAQFPYVKTDVAYIHTDEAREWEGDQFNQFIQDNGITLETSSPYAHEQNGLAERANRTVIDTLRSLLIQSKLPEKLWPILLDLAIQHVNLSPHPMGNKGHEATPFQDLYKRPSPLYSKLRPCGTLTWVTYGIKPQNKLSPRAQPMAYVGHQGSHKYLLWDGRTIRKARDVSFSDELWADYMQDLQQQSINTVTQAPTASPQSEELEPATYQAAVSSPQAELWQQAMKQEMEAQTELGTWIEVPKREAQGYRILSGKWVYKIKEDGRFKARWVVRGFNQDLDPFELTRAAVVQGTTTKILLQLAATYGWQVRTADVKNAFLNGNHTGKPVYLQMPVGFGKPGTICKLEKSLYGLKTAPLQWYNELRNKLEYLDFKPSRHDECLFIRTDEQGNQIYVTVHVDDLAIYNDIDNEVTSQLGWFFKLNPTDSTKYLGLRIRRRDNGFHISQSNYTREILNEFKDLVRSSRIPIQQRAEPQAKGVTATNDQAARYRRLVGKLMYLSYNSRPDITFAVIHASSFAHNPSPTAWEALRDILGYLDRTSDYGINVVAREGNTGILQLEQYSDASFATGSKGKSISGRITTLNGTPIAWQSHQQTSVATSTAHSEFIAAFEAAQQVIPLHDILQEVAPAKTTAPPPKLMVDNQATITIANQGVLTRQNRYFLVKYYWLHEQINDGKVIPYWVNTNEQLADTLTKPAAVGKLQDFIKATGIGN